jgi:hypothetical protein
LSCNSCAFSLCKRKRDRQKKAGFPKGDDKKKVGNAKKANVPFVEEAGKWKFIIAPHVFENAQTPGRN